MNMSRNEAFHGEEAISVTPPQEAEDAHSSDTVRVTIPGLPQFIGVARQAVDALGEQIHLSPDDRMAVRLAVGEACNNAVYHSPEPANRSVGNVIVACRILPEALEIDITNNGNAFHPSEFQRTEMPEALAEHGRGMPLMEMLMDSVEYLSERGNTVVRMRKLRREASDGTHPGTK